MNLIIKEHIAQSDGGAVVPDATMAMSDDGMRKVGRVSAVQVERLLGVKETQVVQVEGRTSGVIKLQIAPAVVVRDGMGREGQCLTKTVIVLRREHTRPVRARLAVERALDENLLRGGVVVGKFQNAPSFQHDIGQAD